MGRVRGGRGGMGPGEAAMTTLRAVDTPPVVALPLPDRIRSGAPYWFASLGAMLRFDFGRSRQWAPLMAIVQVMMGAGMAITYGFFYPHVSGSLGTLIATGTPTLALIPLGFVMVPAAVGQQRLEGTFDFIWSLPSPRSAQVTSMLLLYTLLSLPGMALALLVAVWRYGVDLHVSPLFVPAVLLCAVMAVSVGFGMALAIPNPMVVNVITNALIFVVLLFTPIVFPASQVPDWLFHVQQVLPFYNMALVIRAGLTVGIVGHTTTAFLVLTTWAVAGIVATGWVIGHRR
jgi:ABC-2 type transport system permease protein